MARISASDREKKTKDNTMDKLISSQPSETEKLTPQKKPSSEELKRQTYYLTSELIDAIRVMGFVNGEDKSVLVRRLLAESSLKEYIGKQAKI